MLKNLRNIIAVLFATLAACACTKPGNNPGIVLEASKTDIQINETINFKVLEDGNDVTSDAVIKDQTGEPVNNASWSSGTPGTYTFTAEYNGSVSNNVTVKVNEENGGQEEKYRKKAVIHKFTGTWCGYCPNFTKVLNQVSADNPDRLLVISVHCSDPYSILDGATLEEAANVSGYPTGWIDHREQTGNSEANVTKALQKSLIEYPAVCSIKGTSSINDRTIDITAEIEFGEEGEYKICAALLENNVYCEEDCTEPSKTYHHILRQLATDPLGEDLGTVQAGKMSHEFQFKAAKSWNIEECEVIVYILKKYGNNYFVNNAEIIPL